MSNVNVNNLKILLDRMLDNKKMARVVSGTIIGINPVKVRLEKNNLELDEEFITVTWQEGLNQEHLNRKCHLIRQEGGNHFYMLYVHVLRNTGGYGYGNAGASYGGSGFQVSAELYDESKANGAGPISTAGWNEAEINAFRMDAADPPYVTGQYIDDWLRQYYPDSPLIGHGNDIKLWSDFYGISAVAALGVWAKETTFGRGEPGNSFNNFGCMIAETSPDYPSVYIGDRAWASFPDVSTGIGEWFRYTRERYLDQGVTTYGEFLDIYSPKFENDQSTFKNLMWGTVKAFGVDVNDTVSKSNQAQRGQSPANVNIVTETKRLEELHAQQNTPVSGSSVGEAMIDWMESKIGKATYSMASRNGPYSYDCSSAVYSSMIYAGVLPAGHYLGSTETLFQEEGGLLQRIDRSQVQRGDIFVSGVPGGSSGAAGHTGIAYSPSEIIHMTYGLNGIGITGIDGWTGSPTRWYRIRS